MCLITEHARAKQKIKELEAQVAKMTFPAPPTSIITINANEIFTLLLPYGINIVGGMSDWEYRLMTHEDANRFMKWYKQNAPIKPSDYTPDDRDCDDFGWFMRTFALWWSESKYLWGYTESESADPEYPFPNHGFDFLIISDKTVWFADQLGVAAPDDEIMEAYTIKCNMAKC